MHTAFVKMHGCGNDFVILDGRPHPLTLTPARAAAIASRRTGIGCDQVIVIEPAVPQNDALMRILNPDGSQAGACGNATRCVAAILAHETGRTSMTIGTPSGDLFAHILPAGQIEVDMGPARLHWSDIPLLHPMDTLRLELTVGALNAPAAASMGNPHVTFFVEALDAVPIAEIGPALEHDPLFPQHANIGFAQIVDMTTIRLRVWERAAGLTLACGSGACAALVNAHRRGLVKRRAQVILDGGRLLIEWRDDGHVLMTGPVATAFIGQIDLEAYPA